MITLHQKQREIVQNKARFRVLLAGRRFGKTVLAVEEMIFNAVSKKDARIVYISPTFQSSRDIAWEQLKNRITKIDCLLNESRLEVEIPNKFGGKGKILLRSWDAIETLRGQFFDFIILDEVAQFRGFWNGWHEVLRPTLSDRKGRAMFISTPKGFNHFYDLYNLENKDSDYKSFKFTTYDNPFIPKEEVDKAQEEMTEDRFAQEYLADFRKTEGLVYKEFNRQRHVTESFPETYIETILGVDFGYTNPAAIIPARVDGDSHYWIREEWYERGKTVEQIAERALSYKSTKCYPDPENSEGCATLRKAGLNVRDANKAIVAGIDHVRELFKQGRIHIHPDCTNLIYELETYRYPDKRPDQNEPEKPIKENDHLLDALRYALFTSKPITFKRDPIFETHGTHYVLED